MKLIENRLYWLSLLLWVPFILPGCQKIDFCNAGDPFTDCYQKRTILSTIQRESLLATIPPTSPTNVSVVSESFTNKISWSSVPRAIEYQLYWSNSPNQTITNATKISNVTSPFSHTGLVNGRVYYYKVTAKSTGSLNLILVIIDLMVIPSS